MSRELKKITVLGSINMDMLIELENIPQKGETVFGKSLDYFSGGKGANQAVASRRLGSSVTMLGLVGKDENGEKLLANLEKEGIVTDRIKKVEGASGMAIVELEASGENSIVVFKGANDRLDIGYVLENKDIIEESDLLISQFEIPIESIKSGFALARDKGVRTILNPAPASRIDKSLLAMTDIIIPNETETEIITGIYPDTEEKMLEAGNYFLERGVSALILTLGSRGSFLMNRENHELVPAYKVEVVDTTAAGDSFVGAFSTMINSLDYRDLIYAVKIGTKAASLTIQKKGAQSSLPYLKDIKFKR